MSEVTKCNEERGEISMLKHYIQELLAGFDWKILLSSLVSIATGFYGDLLWGFLSLFIIDWITGVSKSIHKGIPISSKRLRDSVVKLGAYMLLLTALIVTSKYEDSFAPIIPLCYYYFMFTELKSIKENVQEMGVTIPGFLSNKIDESIQDKKDDDRKGSD